MSDEDFDTASFVAAAAALVGIDVTPDQRSGVIMNLESFRALHQRIKVEETPDPTDPLGLFRP